MGGIMHTRISRRPLGLAALALGLLLGPGCGQEGGAPEPPAQPEQPAPPATTPAAGPTAPPAQPATTPAAEPAAAAGAAAEAQQIFSTRCFVCHGLRGAGDGPGSVGLEPPPRNFQDPAWQASVTDDHIYKIVLEGGPAVGKNPLMPPNPDLMGRPEVVAALVAHVRSLESK
jgi:mono/diheme cytochrome c family protein